MRRSIKARPQEREELLLLMIRFPPGDGGGSSPVSKLEDRRTLLVSVVVDQCGG